MAEHPQKLPQIRRFLNYYLPTTLKLLNAYDRMDSAGVAGANIDGTMGKIESMLDTVEYVLCPLCGRGPGYLGRNHGDGANALSGGLERSKSNGWPVDQEESGYVQTDEIDMEERNYG